MRGSAEKFKQVTAKSQLPESPWIQRYSVPANTHLHVLASKEPKQGKLLLPESLYIFFAYCLRGKKSPKVELLSASTFFKTLITYCQMALQNYCTNLYCYPTGYVRASLLNTCQNRALIFKESFAFLPS